MSSGAKLTKEILIVGTGMAFAVASAIIASMFRCALLTADVCDVLHLVPSAAATSFRPVHGVVRCHGLYPGFSRNHISLLAVTKTS
jgi:hypothetical protein